MSNIYSILYAPSMGATKYFVCVQLRRIFCPHETSKLRSPVWWALQALIVTNVLYYVIFFFTFVFQCIPRRKIWDPTVEGRCLDSNTNAFVGGVINLILDIGALIVPIWAIWHLQMTFKRKLGAVAIFATGIL